jgi:3-hydroxyisobutyrate dehydrogenase
MQIGYIGLGAMGGALARRLVATHPLIVLDINPSAVAAFRTLGARAASSAAELARQCDVVILCLPRSSDVHTVIFGRDGLAEGLSPGKLVIDQTSGVPSETNSFAAELAKLGVAMVDAPVAGGPRGADAGTITMMLSGPDDACERALSVLERIGPNVLRSGSRVGDGQAMKLVNNVMNACLRVGTLEIVAMGRKMGLSLKTMVDILNKGSGRNRITEVLLKDILRGVPSTNFGLPLMLKDVNQAITLGMQNGVPMPFANIARGLLQIGISTLGANSTLEQVVELIESMAASRISDLEADDVPQGLTSVGPDELTVGFVGLGTMGGALVRRLMLSRQMHVFDLRTDILRDFVSEGAIAANDLPSLARACHVIFVCVPTSADVRRAVFGPGGLAEGLSPGKIIVDQTTGDPVETRAIAADLKTLGVTLVDAPVSGGSRGAVAGTIAIMCGGPSASFEAVRPILGSISPNYVYCGQTGNGHLAKVINNAVASCNRLITYESAAMGFKYGLSVNNMATVLNKGSASSNASERILPALATGRATADFKLLLMAKDLRLASQIGFACGAPMMIANAVRGLFEVGVNELGGDANLDDMRRLFEAMAGIKFAGG